MNVIEKVKVTVKEHKKVFIGAGMAAGVIASAGVGYLCGVRTTNTKWNSVCNLAAFGEEVVKVTDGHTGDKYNMVLTKVVETVEDVVEI
jgi:hypothetical protein